MISSRPLIETAVRTVRYHTFLFPHISATFTIVNSEQLLDFGLFGGLILNNSLMWFLFVRPEICHFPSDSNSRWTPLVLAVSFPLPGRIGDFHPLEMCTARHTKKARKSFTDFLASALPYSISFCNPFIQQYLSGKLSWPSVQSHDFLESLLHNMQHLLWLGLLEVSFPPAYLV